MKRIRLILCGCGGVGKQFLELMAERQADIQNRYQLNLTITAAVDIKGAAVAEFGDGLPAGELVSFLREGNEVQRFPAYGRENASGPDLISTLSADVLVEATPTNLVDGGAGTRHIFAAVEKGMEVVAANKGPFVLFYKELFEKAAASGSGLHISAATAAALPTLDVGLVSLAGTRILSMEGILNGTTNYILSRMQLNQTPFDVALKQAQQAGIAETDPRYDLEGKDTANKTILIANRVFGAAVGPADISVEGITGITAGDIEKTAAEGRVIKLIGSVERRGESLNLYVRPKAIEQDHPLAWVNGSEKAITYRTDTMGHITVSGGKSSPRGAAAALLKDLVNAFT